MSACTVNCSVVGLRKCHCELFCDSVTPMWETVILTGVEQQRLVVLNKMVMGDLTGAEAAAAPAGRGGRCAGNLR
jgi:hypothetical protein